MTFRVIDNPYLKAQTGFTTLQFKKLDGLFLRTAADKVLTYRTVECDFDEEVASYTYYERETSPPFLQFIIRKVGPKAMMYEVFKQGKGRIAKSGVFDIAFDKLQVEIESLLESP